MEYCQHCIFLDERLGVCNHPKLEGRAKDAHEKCQGSYKLTWMENKLLTEKGYTPYCGAKCGCMPRTFFNGSQFQCPNCGWKSCYSARFIKQYKEKWGHSANRVESKFRVGDWITNGDYVWKIVEVKPLDYILQSQDGNTVVDDTISYVDEHFYLIKVKDEKQR